MSCHWFEEQGCPTCKHIWRKHCFSADRFFLRQVQPYVVNEELTCPNCKHEFVYPVVHHYALPGHGVELSENTDSKPFAVHTCVDGTVLFSDGLSVSPDAEDNRPRAWGPLLEVPNGNYIRTGTFSMPFPDMTNLKDENNG